MVPKPELGNQRTGNVRGLSACTMLFPDESLLEFVRWGLAGAARDVYNGDHCAGLLVGMLRPKSCLKRSIPPCNLSPPKGEGS